MTRRVLVLCATELKLLLRNRTAAVLAIVMPVGIALFLAFGQPEFAVERQGAADVWPALVTLQILAMLGFTGYITTTTAFSARRQDLYLKRLRSGEVADAAIIAGVALPTLVLAIVQVALVFGITVIAGASAPRSLLLLAVAVLGGAVMCSAAGILTSIFTESAEHSQVTTAPFFFVFLAGGVLAMNASSGAGMVEMALPGGAIAELVRLSWRVDGALAEHLPDILPALGALLAWIVALTILSRRFFRWEPRAEGRAGRSNAAVGPFGAARRDK